MSTRKNYNRYPTDVYLPTATLGPCRNVKKCKSGWDPPYEVPLGDGWCIECYDKKVSDQDRHKF